MFKLAGASIALAVVLGGLSLRSPEQFFRTNLGVLDTSEPISFYIEDGTGVPGFRPSDRELAKTALEAWSRESGARLKFREAPDSDSALVRLRWVSAGSGLFGQMERLHVNGKVGAMVFVMPEVENLGEPLSSRARRDSLLRDTIVYLTCVHELGHAVGMPHTDEFADIMYSFGYGGDIVEYFMRYRNKLQSRDDIQKHSGLSSGDLEFLKELYK